MLHNIEAEQSVIAAVLLDNDCLDTFTRLKKEHFYSPAHQIIYEAICHLANKNVAVDLVTLSERLQRIGKLDAVGGNDYLTSLTDLIPTTANFKHHIAILKKNETLRRLATVSSEINKIATSEDDESKALQKAEKLIFDISKEREKKELTNLGADLPTVMENFEIVTHDPGALKGMKTGFVALDGLINGLQKGNLIILGARPSVGKSSLGLNIALNVALGKKKAKVAIFSLEMTKVEVATRALCSTARVSLTRANRGNLGPDDWPRLWEANKKLQAAHIYVDDTSNIPAAEITRKCMRLKREQGGLDLVMVDYLGLMAAPVNGNKNMSRQEQVAENSWMMKTLAKELDVPVLLLAQLNRGIEKREKSDSEPLLSDLRESGAIEQNADIVMFIHKPKAEMTESVDPERSRDYEAKIIVAKNRNGATSAFPLHFVGKWTTFVNPDEVDNDPEPKTPPLPPEFYLPPIGGDDETPDAAKPGQPAVVPVPDSDVSDIF